MRDVDWRAEVARRFQDYPEAGFRYEAEHRIIRQACRQLAVTLVDTLPPLPEKMAVLDKLDEVLLLAQAVVDRQSAA